MQSLSRRIRKGKRRYGHQSVGSFPSLFIDLQELTTLTLPYLAVDFSKL